MRVSLHSLADRIRQIFGTAESEDAVLKQKFPGRPAVNLVRGKRIKVAVLSILLGVVSGVLMLTIPLEDGYRVGRAFLRVQPAPQDIAMIALDDATLNELGGKPVRANDSELMDDLVAAGVERIVWDRAFADPESPEADAQLERTLQRHKGKVWIGLIPGIETPFHSVKPILPLPRFRDSANIASMATAVGPWNVAMVPTEVVLDGKGYPSLAAVLGKYSGERYFVRPDLAIDPGTVPTFSYVDVLRGRIDPKLLKGKRVIIAESFFLSSDFFVHPVFGRMPAGLVPVTAAHTLKRGAPIDLSWYPGMLLAGLAILMQVRARRRSSAVYWVVVIGLMGVALVLDDTRMSIDIMPALLSIGVAVVGQRRVSKKYLSGDIDAMTTTAISSDRPSTDRDVYALKIANLAELSEEWSARETGEFVNTLIAYVKDPGEVDDVAFERDVLVWLAPRMEAGELELHADGLALMLKTAISHDWQSSNGAPALGIDTNHDLPVALRIKKAMQAADEAGTRGVRFIINDAAHLEARNNRLELIRVLEKGLRDRDITVAYQPKVDLASRRIVGAETLIRWRPEGGAFVNPQELVLAAEAADRINELTRVVMEIALVEAKQAIALDPRFKLAVNMSAKSLSDTHLLFDIMTQLGRIDFPPENLTLELTETAKLEDHRIAPQIAALKARGIGLSIDDFGTGQSNLEYIEKLPSSELKIDKRFVQHMATSEESRAVVRATIEIAHSLGKLVVAEGVEDEAMLAELLALGCDQAQGYLFSEAIAMPQLLTMMGQRLNAVNA
ncbi:MAG: EAL domain-containing protein [Porphyrobacter sp.]|jgi:EAL domain-containing protein (putative c-di-GMP-specific phosphodiesterase class I)/CHASE2 domain-containing sensor protein|nr:EAL domain-containing protein [Porphyrobacter sp.]